MLFFQKIKSLTLLCLIFSLILPAPRAKAGNNPIFIRDAEIEYYIRDLGQPIFHAAGIPSESIKIILIQNSDLNAFVAGGMNIFLYTGLLQKVTNPEELLGVIAHETGHIAGGHLIRGHTAMKNASTEAIIGMVFGVAAAIAAGSSEAGMAAVSAAQHIAERNLLHFSRTQESSADLAAISFLEQSGVTSEGLLSFMEKLKKQEALPIERQAEYNRTHPLTNDRIALIREHFEKSHFKKNHLSRNFQERHARMKGKLLGYLQPQIALLRYTDKDKRPFARYARAIAYHKTHKTEKALNLINGLLTEESENPFFYDTKAQILFESGHPSESIPVYAKALALKPSSELFHFAYAQALLEGTEKKTTELLDQVIQHFLQSNRLGLNQANLWRYLATAWGQKYEITGIKEDEALISYALAEEALALGEEEKAQALAARALKKLEKQNPYYLRAQDIKLKVENNADR